MEMINPLTFMGNSSIINNNVNKTIKREQTNDEFVKMLMKNILLKNFNIGLPVIKTDNDENSLFSNNNIGNEIISDIFKDKFVEELSQDDIFNLKGYLKNV